MTTINIKEHYFLGCIYLLKFPNNKVYIGRTCNLYKRIRLYKSMCNKGDKQKHDYIVSKAIREFGFDNIKLEILEVLNIITNNIEREKYYIKLYDSTNIEKGYNISAGPGCLGCKYLNRQDIKKRKKVRCIETGVIYESIKDANNKTGISNGNIVSCCKGNRNFAGGFTWEYVN